MASKYDNFFSQNLKFIKLGGMWIPESEVHVVKKVMWWLYNVFVLSYCILVVTPLEVACLFITYKDLSKFIKNMNMTMQHVSAYWKVFVWYSKRKELLQIINVLKEQAVYQETEDFQPEKIIETSAEAKRKADYFYIVCAANSATSAAINCLVMMYIKGDSYENYVEDTHTNNTIYKYTQSLPYYSVVPWDYTSSKLSYGWAVIFQWYCVFHYAFIIVGFDTLFTSFLMYSSAHIQVLMGAIKTIRSRSYKTSNLKIRPVLHEPEIVAKLMNKEMDQCINHLQAIFRVCERLEEIFNKVTLFQTLVSLIIFCTCLYLVSEVPAGSSAFFVELVYLVGIEWQLFQYCYYGNQVTLTSTEISYALFESDWLSAPRDFKNKMLFTMTRAKKPIFFTTGKFSPLTLTTFVTIGRGSYSFYAFLRNKS